MMRSFLLTIVFVFLAGISFAQTVEVLKKVQSTKSLTDTRFEFLTDKVKTANTTFIATIKATGRENKASLSKLYFKLKDQAYILGANSFKLNAYAKDAKLKEAVLTLDIFKLPDSVLTANKAHRESNVLFVFLNDFTESDNYTFTINDSEREIKSGMYYRYQLKPKQSATVEPAGILSSSFTFKWKEGNPPIYLTLTDFGQEKPSEDYDYSGRFFNTKRINFLENDLGELLVKLLKPVN